jgi:hypothetical protein
MHRSLLLFISTNILLLSCIYLAQGSGERFFMAAPEKTALNDSITLLRPIGEIVLDADSLPVFEWAVNFSYNGTFTLKILELNPDQPLPDSLPDVGLHFLQSGIVGTLFAYPPNAPELQAGRRYAWQVETDFLVNGKKVKGDPFDFTPVPPFNCDITIGAVPAVPLCPGECFTLSVSLPTPIPPTIFPYQHRFTLYTDHPGLPGNAVTVNGMPAYEQSLLCGAVETPQVAQTGGSTANLTICINEGSPTDVAFTLYYNRPSSACATQCATSCCHSTVTFSVPVANITGYTGITLEVRDITGVPIQEACATQPVSIVAHNAPVGSMPLWQCSDDNGMTWQDIATGGLTLNAFLDALLSLDCSTNPAGFWDKIFRAKFTISDPSGTVCEFFSDEQPLRICCPLTSAALAISPNSLLCEGDDETFSVSLTSSDLFVQVPGDYVGIEWFVNGTPIGFSNQTSFSHSLTLGETDVCFTAEITNCAGKKLTVTQCVPVDPRPVCGSITGASPNLTLVSEDPITGDKTYTICPGKDAVLEAIGYDKCTINWEYSDDGGSTWLPVGGVSNTIQNTNTLFPPGSGCRDYRLLCKPKSDPSGCPTCISNIVRICEVPEPSLPIIGNCIPQVCKGDPIALSVSNVEAGVAYTWLCNGLEIATGPALNLAAEKSACYWVEANNGCFVAESDLCCIEVCETVAIISCPLPPNECACFGEPIMLTAEASYSTCPPGDLIYEWHWLDELGAPQSSSSVSITDTPPIGGTLYSLTVTDLLTGCVDEAQLFIKPCVKF